MSNKKSSLAGGRLVHEKTANITLIVNVIKYVLIGGGVLVSALFFILAPKDKVSDGELLFVAMYALLALAVALLVVFYIVNLIENPKGIKYLAIGAVVTALLVFGCYQISNSDVQNLSAELRAATPDGAIRWTEAGLYVSYVLGAVALLSILVAGVRNLFK